jgi:phosphate transport system protein
MSKRFEHDLEMLNTQMIEMGMLIETSIQNCVTALINQDIDLAKQTVEFDIEINQKEKEIESNCLRLLLQQHPVARDLRLISAALKMITDMERIGDQAADISELA